MLRSAIAGTWWRYCLINAVAGGVNFALFGCLARLNIDSTLMHISIFACAALGCSTAEQFAHTLYLRVLNPNDDVVNTLWYSSGLCGAVGTIAFMAVLTLWVTVAPHSIMTAAFVIGVGASSLHILLPSFHK